MRLSAIFSTIIKNKQLNMRTKKREPSSQHQLRTPHSALIGHGQLARHDWPRARQQAKARHIADRGEDADEHNELDDVEGGAAR